MTRRQMLRTFASGFGMLGLAHLFSGDAPAGAIAPASPLSLKPPPSYPAKAKRAGVVLGHLIDRAESGMVDLFYLDECGFAPSLLTGSSWSLPGQRKRSATSTRRAAESTCWRRISRLPWPRGWSPLPSSGR